jgi:hypothetical protein
VCERNNNSLQEFTIAIIDSIDNDIINPIGVPTILTIDNHVHNTITQYTKLDMENTIDNTTDTPIGKVHTVTISDIVDIERDNRWLIRNGIPGGITCYKFTNKATIIIDNGHARL